jgi:hypothetical protein
VKAIYHSKFIGGLRLPYFKTNPMKVSFDFDGTLEFEDVQNYAKELIRRGIEVWVVTTRYDANHRHKWTSMFPGKEWAEMYEHNDGDPNFHLWGVVEKLGIPRHHVRFTCMEWKYTYLTGTKFAFHLDDNPEEFQRAKHHECNVTMVDVMTNDWKTKCNLLIEKYASLDKQ